MMTDTAAGFLADIIANPDDDAVRLIYADWLDENDEAERAEFIRVQVELARLKPGRPVLRQRRGGSTLQTWQLGPGEFRFRVAAEDVRGLALDGKTAVDAEVDTGQLLLLRDCLLLRVEDGGENTDLVRVTIRLGGPRDPHREQRMELRRRERELLTHPHFWDWFGDSLSPPWVGMPAVEIESSVCEVGYFDKNDNPHWRLTVRRGFVDAIELPAVDWFAYGPSLVSSFPLRAAWWLRTPEILADTFDSPNHEWSAREIMVYLRSWVGIQKKALNKFLKILVNVPKFGNAVRMITAAELNAAVLDWARQESEQKSAKAKP